MTTPDGAGAATPQSTDEYIGERVHQHMWRAKIRQTQVAPQMGMSQTALSRKILGKRSWSIDEVMTIARILDTPVVDLLPPPMASQLRADFDLTGRSANTDMPTHWYASASWSSPRTLRLVTAS